MIEAADDLTHYVTAVTQAVATASTIPDGDDRKARLKELFGQLGLVAEVQRLRVAHHTWEIFDTAVQRLARVAASALVVAI